MTGVTEASLQSPCDPGCRFWFRRPPRASRRARRTRACSACTCPPTRVCVCVYDVIYLHICTHMHTHTHATHACIHVHLCVFTRARAHTHMPRDMLSACWNVPEQAPRGHLPRAGRARQHPVVISVIYVWFSVRTLVACVGALHRSVSDACLYCTHG